MRVRRSRPVFPPGGISRPTRTVLAVVPLLLLVPLAACEGDAIGTMSFDERPGTGRATPVRAGDPTPPIEPEPARNGEDRGKKAVQGGGFTTAAPRSDAPGRKADGPQYQVSEDRGKKAVQGGGFTTAVPRSDAPGRKADVGPQYQVSEDLDIREVERLVKAVERIAERQRVGQPMATGGSVAAAVGTFSYRWFVDGTVQPDPRWVAAHIRTETVPILGSVTGHKVLFPQLRGALREVAARGLADKIHPEQFGGCYVPRFIGRDTRQGLSLHTWGIAVDLNVPGNLRGTTGEIDRDVVAIFKKWGFAWGGDWAWTDPMHFELAQMVKAR